MSVMQSTLVAAVGNGRRHSDESSFAIAILFPRFATLLSQNGPKISTMLPTCLS
jgi:hypothetical protein